MVYDRRTDPRERKGGRKGYEWEESQLKQMRRILAKDLKILERLQDKEISPIDEKRLQLAQARVLKIMDKLHISRTQTDLTTNGEPLVIQISEVVAKKYGAHT